MPTTGPGTPPAPRRSAARRWVLVVAVALAVALAAPVGWWLTRPAPDAGVPLAQVRAGTTAEDGVARDADARDAVPSAVASGAADATPNGPTGAGTAAAVPPGPGAFGDVTVRDASLDALAAEADPAPARLRIPDLDVDAAVDAVGVEPDGSMTIPAEIASVGWYRFGPAPGAEQGNAVLAGHVDAAGEGPGALFPLRGVEPGTVVTVTDEAGTDHRYEVVGRETVTKDVLPVDEIFARDGEHVLVIITCGGPFQPELRSYRDNVVVTAVPVGADA